MVSSPTRILTIILTCDLLALDNWEYEPVTPNNHRARQLLRVDQPSPSDMHARINHIEAEIDEIKSEKFRHVQQQIEADEFVIPRDESIYRQKSMEIKMLTNEQSIFQLFLDKGVLLGHVYAGSGVNRVCVGRRNTNQMFDWALVKISPDRLPEREDLARQNMASLHLSFYCCQYSNAWTAVYLSPQRENAFYGHLT